MRDSINLNSFKDFVKSESAGGLLLLGSVAISLVVANSSFRLPFEQILATPIGVNIPSVHLRYTVLQWINDGLMAVFFLLVGLEIKREIVEGELSSFKQASLPVFAAIGGAVAPALIYLIFNGNSSTSAGWGIPMATDIAFALGILSLLGKKVPASLKIFLAALAIADDLIAILVIALFYSADVQVNFLGYSGILVLVLFLLNRYKVKKLIYYLVPGVLLWYFVHQSGIHATVAGVLTAMMIPTTRDTNISPLEKLEHFLTRPVNFFIMPIFALANTNISFEPGMIKSLGNSLSTGIMFGLLLGKPLGILFTSWLVTALKISVLPRHATWTHIAGIGLLGGIGFTMSIFISLLSFSDPLIQTESKFAILITSTAAAIFGYALLLFARKPGNTIN